MGGASGERAVSLASGAQVTRALEEAGHQVVSVDTSAGVLDRSRIDALLAGGVGRPAGRGDALATGDLAGLLSRAVPGEVDLVLPVLHGGAGEDGTVQALLDLMGLPYAGSGRLGCTLSMDKEVSKRLFRDAGIPTPEWEVVAPIPTDPASATEGPPDPVAAAVARLGLPLIVKPPSGGSTLGLSLVRLPEEVEDAVARSARWEPRVLLERFVAGRELTVGVVDGEALPVGEIIPEHEIFDYTCKYEEGMAQEVFPADVEEDVAREVRALALRVMDTLFMRDFGRVDFILDEARGLWCLEANALPGMTATSLLPRAARAGGIPFPELCHRIVVTARRRIEAEARARTPSPGTRDLPPG
ncbi:MAG: D-alanine--D-alanine ligase [Gemmatimonadales bacterium]|nr:MAG: D-alanine--D-alanine ligase [Gemmatimonadales bacterium]